MASAKLPRRGPWLALASAGLFAGLAWFVHPRVQSWRATSRAEDELSALASCLLGAADPRSADDAVLRRRAIGAALSNEDWPARCSPAAAAAEVALSAAQREPTCQDDARCDALARTRGLLADVRAALETRRFERQKVRALFEHAGELGLQLATEDRPLPQPPTPVGEAPPLFTGGVAERLLDPPFGTELRVLFHERPRRARLCALRGQKARCWAPPPGLPLREALSLPSSEEQARPMVISRAGIYDMAGARTDIEGSEVQAHVASDRLSAIARVDDAWWWMAGGERRRIDAREPMLLGDRVVWRDGDALMELTGDAPRRIGDVDSDFDVQSCGTMLLFSKPSGNDTPIVLAIESQLLRATVPSPWFGLTCHRDHADLTFVDSEGEERTPDGSVRGNYRVVRMRCRRGGCKLERAVVALERHRRASRYFAASLGDRLAVLWRSPLGDIRLRIAEPQALGNAKARSLFDDAEHGGFDFDDGNTELFVRGDTGYLLVERETGDRKRAVHAFAIAPSGQVTPLAQRQ